MNSTALRSRHLENRRPLFGGRRMALRPADSPLLFLSVAIRMTLIVTASVFTVAGMLIWSLRSATDALFFELALTPTLAVFASSLLVAALMTLFDALLGRQE